MIVESGLAHASAATSHDTDAISGGHHSGSALDDSIARLRALGLLDTSEPLRTRVEGEGPIVDLVRALIDHAVSRRASDLHLEPQADATRVRLRVDGTMTDALALPTALHAALVNRLKILAELDIVEHRRPQDGQFTTDVDGVTIDVRVSSLPTVHGEKVVLRLLDTRRALLALTELGMREADVATCRDLVRSTFGLVVCAGPTGSGKTTTLYASLLEVDSVGRNVTTIEDPVEYVVPGITQIGTNERTGVGFATGLRALLRQDPDVILVGEIRDVETARIAVQAALTGHLVLTSLHATDAVAALHRLIDMGVPGFLAAASVSGVIGQRLVRRVCTRCAHTAAVDTADLAFFQRHGGSSTRTTFVRGRGCEHCGGTGFHGRIGVFELLRVGSSVRESVVAGEPVERVRRRAADDGMRTMVSAGVDLVERDVTTIGEIVRLLA